MDFRHGTITPSARLGGFRLGGWFLPGTAVIQATGAFLFSVA